MESNKSFGSSNGIRKSKVFIGLNLWIFLLSALFLSFDSASGNISRKLKIDVPRTVGIGQGFWVQGHTPDDFSQIHVRWLGKAICLPIKHEEGQSSFRFLLGTDVKMQGPGKKELELRASNENGLSIEVIREIYVKSMAYPEQRLTVPESKVSLSSKALARHKREKELVSKALNTVSAKRMWLNRFKRPAKGEISSVYGLKRFFNDQARSPHRGVDFRTGMAAPIRASNAGRIILCDEHFFAGKSIYIDHGLGLVSMYFHLSEILVQEDQLVQRGQIIGKSGKTGRVTGPHLHFGLSTFGQLINPLPILSRD